MTDSNWAIFDDPLISRIAGLWEGLGGTKIRIVFSDECDPNLVTWLAPLEQTPERLFVSPRANHSAWLVVAASVKVCLLDQAMFDTHRDWNQGGV